MSVNQLPHNIPLKVILQGTGLSLILSANLLRWKYYNVVFFILPVNQRCCNYKIEFILNYGELG